MRRWEGLSQGFLSDGKQSRKIICGLLREVGKEENKEGESWE